jgi:large subunit ribosomal protein L9
MKLILLERVPKVGQKYETVNVADGYGLNYLIPQGKARTWSAMLEAELMAARTKQEAETQAQGAELVKQLSALESPVTITITAKANEHGHLFAGINGEDVAEAIGQQLAIAVPNEYITLPDTVIKSTGEYNVDIAAADQAYRLLLVVAAE